MAYPLTDQRETQQRFRNPRAQAAASMAGLGGLPEQREAEPYAAAGVPERGMQRDPNAPMSAPQSAPRASQPEADTETNRYYQEALDRYPKATGGGGPKRDRRVLRQMGVANAGRANEEYWDALSRLAEQSNPENIAEQYGQQYEQLGQYFDRAEGSLDRSLAARGLSDSSAMVGGQAALASGRASAQAGLSNQISQEARQREDMRRRELMQMLTGQQNFSGDMINQILNQKMQAQQFKAQQGDWLDSLMGLAGAGAQIARFT